MGQFEFELVVKLRMSPQARQLLADQVGADPVLEPGRQKRVEAGPHVDVRVTGKRHQQGGGSGVAVAIFGPLASPDFVGDQILIEGAGQGIGASADDLGRIPVGHHPENGRLAHYSGAGTLALFKTPAGQFEGLIDAVIGHSGHPLDGRQRAQLQHVHALVLGHGELDVEGVVTDQFFQLAHGRHDGSQLAAGRSLEAPRAEVGDQLLLAAPGDRVGSLAAGVVVESIVGRAATQRARQHHPGETHSLHHRLDQDLMARVGLAVRDAHFLDGLG